MSRSCIAHSEDSTFQVWFLDPCQVASNSLTVQHQHSEIMLFLELSGNMFLIYSSSSFCEHLYLYVPTPNVYNLKLKISPLLLCIIFLLLRISPVCVVCSFLSSFTWVLGVRFRTLGLQGSHFYLLSHFPGPAFNFLKDIFVGYRILTWQLFPFRYFEEMIPLILGLHCFIFVSLFPLESCLIKSLSSPPLHLLVAIGERVNLIDRMPKS